MNKQVVIGFVVGMALGSGLTVLIFPAQDVYEVRQANGNAPTLKINKRTGQTWALSVDGQWVEFKNLNSKLGHYRPPAAVDGTP